jgi:hypothetical protein
MTERVMIEHGILFDLMIGWCPDANELPGHE